MQIRNVTEEKIQNALDQTNKEFDNNLRFREISEDGKTRAGLPKFKVTLTVQNSRAKGGRISPWTGRRIAAACWHAYGTFMDSLPEETEIVVRWVNGVQKIRPGDPWQDMNIGGPYRRSYYSDACEC